MNVGSNKGLHYTYDMDHGNMVQLWRGEFLDATPMWHDRGDGSWTAAEIEIVTGFSAGSVATRLTRARHRLAAQLHPEGKT